MNRFLIFFSLILLVVFSSCSKQKVTLESLLDEMTNKIIADIFPGKQL